MSAPYVHVPARGDARPLWQRALEMRKQEARSRKAARQAAGVNGRPRKYPPAKVGDVFGVWTVIALLPRDATCNERVKVRCGGGHERDRYVFNLRGRDVGRPCRSCGGSRTKTKAKALAAHGSTREVGRQLGLSQSAVSRARRTRAA